MMCNVDVKELARTAFNGRAEKLSFEEEIRMANVKKNTEIYAKNIINIFIASNSRSERTLYGLYIVKNMEKMEIKLAYTAKEVENDYYYDLSRLSAGTVKDRVKEFNEQEGNILYRDEIMTYFKINLSEFFDVIDYTIILKDPTICEN